MYDTFIFRLKAGATGIIKRPSRMVGVTSLSTTPSDCAARRMDCRLRDIPLIVIVISLRICDRVEEALSLTLPNLSRMLSIFPINWEDKDISRQFSQGRILDFLIVHGLEEAYDVIDRLQGTFEVE